MSKLEKYFCWNFANWIHFVIDCFDLLNCVDISEMTNINN